MDKLSYGRRAAQVTMSSRRGKLSTRLNQIFNLVSKSYLNIYDTCCDHGYLGMAFLEAFENSKVFFIDQVPLIISSLKKELESNSKYVSSSYEVLCQTAEETTVSEKNSLVLICGVGGDTVIEILKNLQSHNDVTDVDFIIDAQYQLFELRQFLRSSGFGLIDHCFFFEGKWGHEVLYVSKSSTREISIIGEDLFQVSDKRHVDYITSLKNHYIRKAKRDIHALGVAKLYEKVLSGLS